MRLAAPTIAIASLAALVAGQSKVTQIEDGQVQGPALSAYTYTPHLVVAPPPCPATVLPIPPKVSGAGPCSGQAPAASMTGVGAHSTDDQIQIPKPTPIITKAPPPIIFEGGALAREYPVGGAMALCAVAIALAMI